MAQVFDFLKRLYRKKAQDPDPILQALYKAAAHARTQPAAVAARERLLRQYSKTEEDYDRRYAAYYVALTLNRKTSDWNREIEEFARMSGVPDARIEKARVDFGEAVIQRVEVCWFMEAGSHVKAENPATSGSAHNEMQERENDVGSEIVQAIYRSLNIDQQWSTALQRGFAWWGHRLRQRVWSTPGRDDRGIFVHRIFVVSDFVRNVRTPTHKVETILAPLGELAIGSAMVFDPETRTIKLWTTATVHREIAPWMKSLLPSYTIIQAVEADARSAIAAEMVQGDVDDSGHPTNGPRSDPDEMMSVLDAVFRPIGAKRSPWIGSDEFKNLLDIFERKGVPCSGGENGLSAELRFGNRTSLLRISATEQNPVMGSGVGIFLQLPISVSAASASAIAAALNRAETAPLAPGHMIGSWLARSGNNSSMPAFATFIPSAMHQPGTLFNLTLGHLVRARQVDDLLSSANSVSEMVHRSIANLASPTSEVSRMWR